MSSSSSSSSSSSPASPSSLKRKPAVHEAVDDEPGPKRVRRILPTFLLERETEVTTTVVATAAKPRRRAKPKTIAETKDGLTVGTMIEYTMFTASGIHVQYFWVTRLVSKSRVETIAKSDVKTGKTTELVLRQDDTWRPAGERKPRGGYSSDESQAMGKFYDPKAQMTAFLMGTRSKNSPIFQQLVEAPMRSKDVFGVIAGFLDRPVFEAFDSFRWHDDSV